MMLKKLIFIVIFTSITYAERNSTSLEIVFLHEENQSSFTSAVDGIMKELQLNHPDIEINYLKLLVDRQGQNSRDIYNRICEMGMKDGISMFIDGTLSGFDDEIRKELKTHEIPYFNFDFTIGSVVKVLHHFLHETSSDVLLILQDEISNDEVLHYNLNSESPLRFIAVTQPIANIAQRLKSLRPTPDFFIIIADSDKMMRILQDALDVGLVSRHTHQRWNLMFIDHNVENFKSSSLKYPEMNRLILSHDVCCNPKCICTTHNMLKFEALSSFLHQSVNILMENGMKFPFKRKFVCGDDAENSTSSSSLTLLDDLMKAIDANQLIYIDDMMKIWQNVKFDIITTTKTENSSSNDGHRGGDIATLDGDNNKKMMIKFVEKPQRFFRIGVTESAPYTNYKRDSKTNEILTDSNGAPIYEGYCIDFIVELSQRMNFTYELVEPSTGKFGEKMANGIFDGLIGDLAKGDLDMVVAASKITADREEVIDFVIPYFDETGILIMMKKPLPDQSLFKFMTVLRLEVWLSILGALCVTAFVIWLLDIFSPYSSRNWNYGEQCRKFSLRECFWLCLTSFTPQGGGEAPKSISGRVVVGAYWLFVVLMLATFTANLAAFLTVERMQSPVQSLDQLARQSRINFTVVQDSDTHKYFKNMKHSEDVIFELWKNVTLGGKSEGSEFRIWDYPVKEQYGSILMAIDRTKPLTDASQGFQIINERDSNDFAFIHDANEIKYQASKNCNFSIVGEIFAEQPYAIAVQQGSSLAEEISKVILLLQKDRFLDDLKAKYWNSSAASCGNDDDSEGITLQSLGGIFIATIVGLVLAMLVLIAEVFYYKKKTRNDLMERKKENEKTEENFKNGEIFTTKIYPFEYLDKQSVLLGPGHFIPVDLNLKKKSRFSPISVRTRD